MQQDPIGNAGLDTKPDKPRRFDIVSPAAMGQMKTQSRAARAVHDGALYVGLVNGFTLKSCCVPS